MLPNICIHVLPVLRRRSEGRRKSALLRAPFAVPELWRSVLRPARRPERVWARSIVLRAMRFAVHRRTMSSGSPVSVMGRAPLLLSALTLLAFGCGGATAPDSLQGNQDDATRDACFSRPTITNRAQPTRIARRSRPETIARSIGAFAAAPSSACSAEAPAINRHLFSPDRDAIREYSVLLILREERATASIPSRCAGIKPWAKNRGADPHSNARTGKWYPIGDRRASALALRRTALRG